MPDEKNFFAGLIDFAFQQLLTRRIVKILYPVAILAGIIAVVAQVVIGMQQSPAQGLMALVAGIVALFVGILLVRLLLEIVLVIIRIAEGIERATRTGG